MIRADIRHADVLYVAQNMREWDRKEIYATRWSDSPSALADDIAATAGAFAWTFGDEAHPIACLGVRNVWPGVWSAWMFATPELHRIGFKLSRFVRSNIVPTLRKSGSHRIQAYSIIGHTDAHKWLHFIGAEIETTHYGFGQNGEDFHVFAMR